MTRILTPDGKDARTLRWTREGPLGMRECVSGPVGRLWRSSDGNMSLIASVDDGSLHLSIAHRTRYPTWEEILAVRAWGFSEETEVVMVLARASEYVNLHPNCFHLWESLCGKEGR